MKVGILTLPLWNNYGGIIQAYALKETLKALNHEVVLIDYHHRIESKKTQFRNQFVRIVKTKILGDKTTPYYPTVNQNVIISKNTLAFIESEFELKTKKAYSTAELKEQTRSLEAIIVGSDQVWRPNYTPNISNFFLDFAKEDQIKLAYAASFGTDEWTFTEEQNIKCRQNLKRFKAISVRESSGIDLVNENFDNEALQLVDPTLLLKKSDYIALINKYSKSNISRSEKLFSYILDGTEENNDIINKLESLMNLKSFQVMPKKFDAQFIPKDKGYVFPPLVDWLKAFDEAKFVVADSFHGCVFSIIFNKPFIAIGNKNRGLTRFNSLLQKFNLENRLVFDSSEITNELIGQSINWNEINAIIENEKQVSIEFLINNLKHEY